MLLNYSCPCRCGYTSFARDVKHKQDLQGLTSPTKVIQQLEADRIQVQHPVAKFLKADFAKMAELNSTKNPSKGPRPNKDKKGKAKPGGP